MFLSWQIYDFFENGGYIIFLGFMSEIALWPNWKGTNSLGKKTIYFKLNPITDYFALGIIRIYNFAVQTLGTFSLFVCKY